MVVVVVQEVSQDPRLNFLCSLSITHKTAGKEGASSSEHEPLSWESVL